MDAKYVSSFGHHETSFAAALKPLQKRIHGFLLDFPLPTVRIICLLYGEVDDLLVTHLGHLLVSYNFVVVQVVRYDASRPIALLVFNETLVTHIHCVQLDSDSLLQFINAVAEERVVSIAKLDAHLASVGLAEVHDLGGRIV